MSERPSGVCPAHRPLSGTQDQDPSGFYRELRDLPPVVWDADLEAYLVSSPDLVEQVGDRDGVDWRSLIAVDGDFVPYGVTHEQWWAYVGSRYFVPSTSGELQKRLHRWWLRELSIKPRLGTWSDHIVRPIADRTIDRFVEAGHADLAAEYIRPAGQQAILAIIGLPSEDQDWIDELHRRVVEQERLMVYVGTPPADVIAECTAATHAIQDLLRPHIKPSPSGEVEKFSDLLWRDADELWGPGNWAENDVIAAVSLAFTAAVDSTVSTTGNALYLLLKHAQLQDELRSRSGSMRNFVEETLRLHSTVSFNRRMAKRDVELGGVRIAEGETVIPLSECVGHDGTRYDEPDEVRLDRADATDHLGFWRGMRRCPGRQVARMEMATLLTVLLERLEDLKLDPALPAPAYTGYLLRAWKPLHTTFHAR